MKMKRLIQIVPSTVRYETWFKNSCFKYPQKIKTTSTVWKMFVYFLSHKKHWKSLKVNKLFCVYVDNAWCINDYWCPEYIYYTIKNLKNSSASIILHLYFKEIYVRKIKYRDMNKSIFIVKIDFGINIPFSKSLYLIYLHFQMD